MAVMVAEAPARPDWAYNAPDGAKEYAMVTVYSLVMAVLLNGSPIAGGGVVFASHAGCEAFRNAVTAQYAAQIMVNCQPTLVPIPH